MRFIEQVKNLFKDSLIYGLGNALGQFIAIFTIPILTRIFVPEEYGVIALLQAAINFLVMIAGFNLISGVYRYYFEYKDLQKKQSILSTSLIFNLAFGVLFSLLIWFVAPFLEKALLLRKTGIKETIEYSRYIRILTVGIVFTLLDMNFRSILRMTRQPYKYMVVNIVKVVGDLLMILLLVVHWKLGIEGALWSGVIASIITSCVGFFLVVRHYCLAFSISFLGLFLSYSLPALPSVLINWSLGQANRFFLNYYAPLAEQGYYAIAFYVAMIFMLFVISFRLAWDPFALSIMKESNARLSYGRFYTLYVVGLGGVGGCIALFAKPVLIILSTEAYYISYSIIFILIWAFLYQGSNNILQIGISISKRTKYISYAQVVSFTVNMIFNFVLIPPFGAWGAAWAFVGGTLAQSLAYYYFAQRVYPIAYDFWRLQGFIALLFGLVMVEAQLVKNLGFLHSALTAICFLPFLGILSWKVGLKPEIRHKVMDNIHPVIVRWIS